MRGIFQRITARRQIGWLSALVVAATGAGCSKHAPPPAQTNAAPPAVAVTVASVTPRLVQRTVSMVGTFYGYDEVTVTPKTDGRVLRLYHDVGDVVHPGEPLLDLDDTDFKLSVTEAQRSLELELAKLGLRELPPKDFDVRKVPNVERAKYLESNAMLKLERARKSGIGLTAEDKDQVETDYRVAQSAYQQTVIEAQAIVAGARHRQAVLNTAKQKLADARVIVPYPTKEHLDQPHTAGRPMRMSQGAQRYPVTSAAWQQRDGGITPETDREEPSEPAERAPRGRAGAVDHGAGAEYVVAQRMVTEGEMVRAGSSAAVFKLVMDQPLKLMATVPERYVGEIRVGQNVQISTEAYPDQQFEGTVARVNPTVDRTNRTFQVEVRVPNETRKLRAGSFAKAHVLTREDDQAMTVPEAALVSFAGVCKVFVPKGDAVQAVEVTPGARLEIVEHGKTVNWVEVQGDLSTGSKVVTTGHSQLADGTAIRLREAGDAKAE